MKITPIGHRRNILGEHQKSVRQQLKDLVSRNQLSQDQFSRDQLIGFYTTIWVMSYTELNRANKFWIRLSVWLTRLHLGACFQHLHEFISRRKHAIDDSLWLATIRYGMHELILRKFELISGELILGELILRDDLGWREACKGGVKKGINKRQSDACDALLTISKLAQTVRAICACVVIK